MTVSPTTIPPDFHITLTDEKGYELGLVLCNMKGEPDPTALGEAGSPRTATRVAQGGGGYDDFKEPFTPILQSDFSAGRGNDDFAADNSRYYDSEGIDSTSGEITLAPRWTPISSVVGNFYGNINFEYEYNNPGIIADKYTLPWQATKPVLYFALAGAATRQTIEIQVRADAAGLPGAIVNSWMMIIPAGQTEVNVYSLQIGETLAGGTDYWMCVKGAVSTKYGAYEIGLGDGYLQQSSNNGVTWTPGPALRGLAWSLDTNPRSRPFLFNYKGQTYRVVSPENNAASTLYMRGYRGAAQSNAANLNLLKTGQAMTANELIGCRVKIIAGAGSQEETPWREIIANTAGGDVTVSPPWTIAQDTTTEFVILGTANKWTAIAIGLTARVTDVVVADDIVYFAQGDAVAIRRFRAYNNAGVWTNQNEADGTATATYLLFLPDDTGIKKAWKAKRTSEVQSAVASAWGTPNTWGTEIIIGNKNSQITGMIGYGNPMIPWVMKEDSFGSIRNSVYAQAPISDTFKAVASELNGRAAMMHDVFLYFSLRNSLERYYDSHLDDVGLDRDEGLPIDRQGHISAMIEYPGRFYAALDAGINGYSAIFCNNLQGSRAGWHEIYRAPIGRRIQDLHIEVLPGMSYDQLVFAAGNDLFFLPICKNPKQLTDFPYQYTGYFITSWYYTQFRDVIKYWDGITIFAEDLVADHQTITVEYQTDNETTWHALANPFAESPSQRQTLSAACDVAGKRIRFRITLTTDDEYQTPRLKNILIDGVTRVLPSKIYNLMFFIRDTQQNLNDRYTEVTPETLKAKVDAWSDSSQYPRPLRMHSCRLMFDDKWVFVEPATWRILNMITQPKNEIRMVGAVMLRGL